MAPTPRAMGGSHANAGGQLAVAIGFDSRQDPVSSAELAGALGSGRSQSQAVCMVFDRNQITNSHNRSNPVPDLCHTLPACPEPPIAFGPRMAVRRLTPRECERLQGFPDDWTAIPYTGGKPAKDGPRYKALGNSMAVPCMAFLGRRIDAFINGELLRGIV